MVTDTGWFQIAHQRCEPLTWSLLGLSQGTLCPRAPFAPWPGGDTQHHGAVGEHPTDWRGRCLWGLWDEGQEVLGIAKDLVWVF